MPPDDWIPEDVYHSIKLGDASLYVFQEAGQFAGFVVLRRLVREFSGHVDCHIWLAYSESGRDAYQAAEAFIKGAAKHMGAQRITFSSPRTGWAKRHPLITATYALEDRP
jgi:hypothetical protein